MKILYIHGLNGSLIPEKREVLERYGSIEAPFIDYENNPDSIIWLYDQYKDAQIDVVMGSSMGGFAGYHLCKALQLPALIFNPALAERSVHQHIPDTPQSNHRIIHIILGSKDPVVNPKATLQFLGDLLMQEQNYCLSIRHDLEHRIPLDVFEEEVIKFMASL